MGQTVQEIRPQTQTQAKGLIDPFDDPVAYLRAHGFKPLGNPDWPSTLWLDTSKPLFGKEEKRPRLAHFLRRNEKDGKVEAILEPVMANDGTGKQKPVQQLHYTPPPDPISMQAALQHCMQTDHMKLMEEERAKKQAA